MTIDLKTETILGMAQATKHVPLRKGNRVSPVTIWRWCVYGKKGVKLESLCTPAGRFTSLEALQRFYEKLGGMDPYVNAFADKGAGI